MPARRPVYEIEGNVGGFLRRDQSRPDTWCVLGAKSRLDDILSGGFGTPDEGFILRWKNHHVSRDRLGYPETVRQVELRLEIIRSNGASGDEAEDKVELILAWTPRPGRPSAQP